MKKISFDGPHSKVTLYHANCLDILPKITGVDSVITDPPYGVEFTTKQTKQHSSGAITNVGAYSHEDTPDYVRSVVVPAIVLCRQMAKGMAVTSGTRNVWEYPPADDMGCFFSPAGTGMGRWGFTCMHPILYYGKDPYLARGMGSRANSCGQPKSSDANGQMHPCAKPVKMMQWLVARASLKGMVVCDPFMGSGTTGVACLQMSRDFIGIEIDEKYFDVAVKRLKKEAGRGSFGL